MNFRREFSAIQYSVLEGEEKRLSVANDPTALITFQALYVRTTRSRPHYVGPVDYRRRRQ